MKKHLCSKVIFSSQGKTSQAHLGAKRNSPVAAGEYKVKQVLLHLPALQSDLDYVGFFFASVECYSAQVDMAQHRLSLESLRVELNSQAQVQDCCQCLVDFLQSTLSTVQCQAIAQHWCHFFQSKYCFHFGPKQQTVISFATNGKTDSSKLDNTFTSRKVLHINSYQILNSTVFYSNIQYFKGDVFWGHFHMIW